MALITFVRHGQASWGAENYDQLSVKGEQQSKILGQVFANQARHFDQVWIGEMVRHRQTAEHCLKETGMQFVPTQHAGLNEFDHEQVLLAFHEGRYASKFEMIQAIQKSTHPKKTLAKVFSQAVLRWQSGLYDHDYTETWLNFQMRCKQVLNDIAKDAQGQNVVVFSSGGVISAIVQSLMSLTNQGAFELNWSMVNCGITQIQCNTERKTVLSLNEHQHLRAQSMDLLTWH